MELKSPYFKVLVTLQIQKSGGGERVRTDDLLRARQALSQLSYTPTQISMVGLGGLEPPTSRLSGVRSNQNWAIGPFFSYTLKDQTSISQNWIVKWQMGVDLGMS